MTSLLLFCIVSLEVNNFVEITDNVEI